MLKKLKYGYAVLGMTAMNAWAVVPAEVQTEIDTGTADGKTIAYSLLVFAIAVGVIMFIKRKASA